jgi:hypothetical protein
LSGSHNKRMLCGRNGLALDLAAGTLLYVGMLSFPGVITSKQLDPLWTQALDPSWQQSLGVFLKADAQAGTDYVFTYGPLGYFLYPLHDSDLWWYGYFWTLVLSGILTLIAVLTARRIGPLDFRLFFYLICFYFLTDTEIQYRVAILELAFLLFRSRPRLPALCTAMCFLAVLSLVKFSMLIYASTAVGLLAASWFLADRRAKALIPLLAYPAAVLGLWLLLAQDITALPTYLRNSAEITSGYNTSMAYVTPNKSFLVSLVVLGINGFFCLLLLRHKPFEFRSLGAVLYGLLCLFVAWKHGFVRDDTFHVVNFFEFVLVFPLVVIAYDFSLLYSPCLRAGLAVCMLLTISNWFGVNNVEFSPGTLLRQSYRRVCATVEAAVHPCHLNAQMEAEYAKTLCDWELPQIKVVVKDSTVDVLSFGQGVVLLNRLNWTPRPVFQSYIAFTKSLLEMNEAFFQGSRAPEFVLLRIEPIDGRFPTLEDSGVLLHLLTSYCPVLSEKDFLLLKHRQNNCDPNLTQPVRIVERTIGFGEEVDARGAEGQYITLSLKFGESIAGAAVGRLYRLPGVRLRAVMASGVKKDYCIIPAMTECPFLLSPLVEHQFDFCKLYTNLTTERIARFSVTAETQRGIDCFYPDVQMKMCTYRLPVE